MKNNILIISAFLSIFTLGTSIIVYTFIDDYNKQISSGEYEAVEAEIVGYEKNFHTKTPLDQASYP